MGRNKCDIRVAPLSEKYAADVARLWRRCLPQEDACRWKASGRPTNRETIRMRILENPAFDPAGSFVALVNGKAAGFCLVAVADKNPDVGYLCALAVDAHRRCKGIGTKLLQLGETYLNRRGVKQILMKFEGNPISLLPGAPTDAEGYSFLLNRGYRGYKRELFHVMRQETSRFHFSDAVKQKMETLEAEGISLALARPAQKEATDKFMAAAFPEWRAGVMAAFEQNPPRALLVASRNGRILGFAGPFDVQDSGKGNFHAIGVDPAMRGAGVGAALFQTLCRELKARGAKFVVLTTGLSNPAQEIYQRAGFRTKYVVDFGMNKNLKAPRRRNGKGK